MEVNRGGKRGDDRKYMTGKKKNKMKDRKMRGKKEMERWDEKRVRKW